MNKIRKPLKKSLLRRIALFMAVLCICLTGAQYFTIRRTLYRQYDRRITDILNYSMSIIDPDDLEECIRTGNESEQFRSTQENLDRIKEQTGVHYLYLIIPLNTDPTDNIRNVMAATDAYEREFATDELVSLNQLTGDAYSPEIAGKYLEAYASDTDMFFENTTAFGTDYTGVRVLKNSSGERVAELCVDFDVREIRGQLINHLLDTLVIVLIAGLLFASMFIVWADRNVIRPVRQLEEAVRGMEEKKNQSGDLSNIEFEIPEIRTGNELESLAQEFGKMTVDMKAYVRDLLRKEKEFAKLSAMANRDPLTRVGNRNAYDSFAEALKLKMTEEPQEYAILVMNTNGLREINDQFGHEKGDIYLLKACRVICETFRHSPVFRLGGDTFCAVLSGEDYRNRAELVKQVRQEMLQAETNGSASPWERVSAAVGITDYDRKTDRTVQSVLDRATAQMQEEKKKRRIS